MVLFKDYPMFPFFLPVDYVRDGAVHVKAHTASLVTQLLTLDRFGHLSGTGSPVPRVHSYSAEVISRFTTLPYIVVPEVSPPR